jgi:hypothetical protein
MPRRARQAAAPRHPAVAHATTEAAPRRSGALERALPWSFLTKHAHVLICLEDNPESRLRALAARVGLSTRAVLRILDDLEGAGHITRRRDPRGTCYEVHRQQSRRCPVAGNIHIDELLQLIRGDRL